MATTKLVTIEDIAHLPDDQRYDLIRGELYTMPPAGDDHGRSANRIGWRISQYADAHGLGEGYVAETGFILARDPDSVLAPDYAFVRTEQLARFGTRPDYADVVPDLVVEVVSPSDYPKLVRDKAREYMQAGVRLLWVVDPQRRTITVHRPNQDSRVLTVVDELDGEDILPGFRLPIATIFA